MPTSPLTRLRLRLRTLMTRRPAREPEPVDENPAPPETEPDFAEERTFSESDPAAQSPEGKGDEAPHRPTRTDSGPERPV